jgi:hypothetical protein
LRTVFYHKHAREPVRMEWKMASLIYHNI